MRVAKGFLLAVLIGFVLLSQVASDAAAYSVDSAELHVPLQVVDVSGSQVSANFSLQVYAPRSAESFPVIWFVTGGGGIAPVSAYSKLLNQVVAKGYIIVGLAHGFFPPFDYLKYGKLFHDIMEWGKDGLLSYMVSHKLLAVPDVLNRSAVMGQSAGNHVVGQGLTEGCSTAKAFVMIDAVDGFDPYRIVKSQDLIKPGQKVNFNIPAILLDNGLDPKSVNRFSPPCAPAEISNDHFYNAWIGPIWNINATKYGHVDCTDTPTSMLCPSDPQTDKDLYRAMLADAITIFLGALFDGRPNSLAKLEDPSQWQVDVVLKHDLKGLDYRGVVPGCRNLNYRSILV